MARRVEDHGRGAHPSDRQLGPNNLFGLGRDVAASVAVKRLALSRPADHGLSFST
jgi:hypothetical protein